MLKPWQTIAMLALGTLGAGLGLAKPAEVHGSKTIDAIKTIDRSKTFDRPGDEDDLNREIWQRSGRRNYERLMAKLKNSQDRSQRSPSLPLPNGWRLAPAGHQIEVGRLPYEALMYQGRLVVMNSGYTGKDPQTISVINPESGRVERTIPIQNLYPSGAVGMDGDLYLSGGFGREVLRLDRNFQLRRRYPIGGYGGPIAALDQNHLVLG